MQRDVRAGAIILSSMNQLRIQAVILRRKAAKNDRS